MIDEIPHTPAAAPAEIPHAPLPPPLPPAPPDTATPGWRQETTNVGGGLSGLGVYTHDAIPGKRFLSAPEGFVEQRLPGDTTPTPPLTIPRSRAEIEYTLRRGVEDLTHEYQNSISVEGPKSMGGDVGVEALGVKTPFARVKSPAAQEFVRQILANPVERPPDPRALTIGEKAEVHKALYDTLHDYQVARTNYHIATATADEYAPAEQALYEQARKYVQANPAGDVRAFRDAVHEGFVGFSRHVVGLANPNEMEQFRINQAQRYLEMARGEEHPLATGAGSTLGNVVSPESLAAMLATAGVVNPIEEGLAAEGTELAVRAGLGAEAAGKAGQVGAKLLTATPKAAGMMTAPQTAEQIASGEKVTPGSVVKNVVTAIPAVLAGEAGGALTEKAVAGVPASLKAPVRLAGAAGSGAAANIAAGVASQGRMPTAQEALEQGISGAVVGGVTGLPGARGEHPSEIPHETTTKTPKPLQTPAKLPEVSGNGTEKPAGAASGAPAEETAPPSPVKGDVTHEVEVAGAKGRTVPLPEKLFHGTDKAFEGSIKPGPDGVIWYGTSPEKAKYTPGASTGGRQIADSPPIKKIFYTGLTGELNVETMRRLANQGIDALYDEEKGHVAYIGHLRTSENAATSGGEPVGASEARPTPVPLGEELKTTAPPGQAKLENKAPEEIPHEQSPSQPPSPPPTSTEPPAGVKVSAGDDANGASAGAKEGQTAAVVKYSREAFDKDLREKFNLPDDQAAAVLAIADARASTWAREQGKKPEEYYPTRIAGVTNEGIGKNATPDNPLLQSSFENASAMVSFQKDGKALIRALKSPTVASAVHELGHIFRRDLSPADLKASEEWAGDDEDFPLKNGRWERFHEERFARGFEVYLREGKAPTTAMAKVFAKFKEWLTAIYHSVIGDAGFEFGEGHALNVHMTDEMRATFDRMLGKEGLEEIPHTPEAKPALGLNAELPELVNSSRHDNILTLDFDARKNTPDPSVLRERLRQAGYQAEVNHFPTNIISGAKGVATYRIDFAPTGGKTAKQNALEAHQLLGGVRAGESSFEKMGTLEQRLQAAIAERGRTLGQRPDLTKGASDAVAVDRAKTMGSFQGGVEGAGEEGGGGIRSGDTAGDQTATPGKTQGEGGKTAPETHAPVAPEPPKADAVKPEEGAQLDEGIVAAARKREEGQMREWAAAHPEPKILTQRLPGESRQDFEARRVPTIAANNKWHTQKADFRQSLTMTDEEHAARHRIFNREFLARDAVQQAQRARAIQSAQPHLAALLWAEKQSGPSTQKKLAGIRASLERGDNLYSGGDVRAAWFPSAKKFIKQWLGKNGWEVDHESDSGSVYLRDQNGVRLRVSDHELGFADYGSRQQSHKGPEVVLDQVATPDEMVERIQNELAQWENDGVKVPEPPRLAKLGAEKSPTEGTGATNPEKAGQGSDAASVRRGTPDESGVIHQSARNGGPGDDNNLVGKRKSSAAKSPSTTDPRAAEPMTETEKGFIKAQPGVAEVSAPTAEEASQGPGAAQESDPAFRAETGGAAVTPENAPRVLATTVSPQANATRQVLSTMDFVRGKLKGASQTARDAINAIADSIRRYAQQSFPALIRGSSEAGDAAATMISSRELIRRQSEHLTAQAREAMGGDEAMDRKLGAVLVEDQLKGIRQKFTDRMNEAIAASAKAKTSEESAAFDAAAALNRERVANVKTLIAAPDSPFKTEADYNAALNDQAIQNGLAAHRQFVEPVIEENYRLAKDLDPEQELPARGADTNSHISLKAIQEDQGPALTSRGLQAGGNIENTLRKYSPFDRDAKGNAKQYELSYSALVKNSIERGTLPAGQARLYKALQDAGIAVVQRTGPAPTIDGRPTVGFKIETKPGESLYVRSDVAPEVRLALNIDKPENPLAVVSHVSNQIALLSMVEAISHASNHLAVLYKSPLEGYHLPTWLANVPGAKFAGILDAVGTNTFRMLTKRLATLEHLSGLANLGALKPDYSETEGLRGGSISKLNPARYVGKLIDTLATASRLAMDDGFKMMVERGIVQDTPRNRRDYINQLGQYHKEAQAGMVRVFRNIGLGPFATAGSTFYTQGLRTLTGSTGAKGTSLANAAKLRAYVVAQIGGTLALVALTNYLRTGKIQPAATPWGSLLLKQNADGSATYEDIADLIGIKRAARTVGADAAIESGRTHRPAGTAVDKSARQAISAAASPFMGPLPTAAITAATGTNVHGLYDAAGRAGPGETQTTRNVIAAAKGLNPTVGLLAEGSQEGKTGLQQTLAQLGRFTPKTGTVSPRATVDTLVDALRKNPKDEDSLTGVASLSFNDKAEVQRRALYRDDKAYDLLANPKRKIEDMVKTLEGMSVEQLRAPSKVGSRESYFETAALRVNNSNPRDPAKLSELQARMSALMAQ